MEPLFFKKSELRDIIQKASLGFNKINEMDSKDLFSVSPPSIFIGSKLRYPKVNVGVLSPPEHIDNAWLYDSPKTWVKSKFSIDEIAKLRTSLINSRFKTSVKSVNSSDKFLDIAQEIGLSSRNVDVEIKLNKKPKIRNVFDNIYSPMGANVNLEKIKITNNPKIDQNVDKVFFDTDLKAKEGIQYLYKKGLDENKISQILSIGALGVKKNRILVPTKWSITASDDIIGKELVKDIKDYHIVNEHYLFTGNYLGNYYFIMLFPEVWSYELFEGYMPGSPWNLSGKLTFATDHEFYEGRKVYANNTVGGYYAAKLPIVEYLKKIKRQASVLVIRFETPEYSQQLGVWVVRSAGKISMSNKPLVFSSKEDMLKNLKSLIFEKFKYNIDEILKKSLLINKINTQTKLFEF